MISIKWRVAHSPRARPEISSVSLELERDIGNQIEHKSIATMLLYLDCCCFNRPFDDLSQIRVRLEAEAVEWILEESRSGRFTIVTSDYLIQELLRNPKPDHRVNTLAMTEYAGLHAPLMESVASRASQIEGLAITGFDALHIAAAEFAGCDYLVTTDDRLLKKSQRHPGQLMVTLLNPIDIILLP